MPRVSSFEFEISPRVGRRGGAPLEKSRGCTPPEGLEARRGPRRIPAPRARRVAELWEMRGYRVLYPGYPGYPGYPAAWRGAAHRRVLIEADATVLSVSVRAVPPCRRAAGPGPMRWLLFYRGRYSPLARRGAAPPDRVPGRVPCLGSRVRCVYPRLKRAAPQPAAAPMVVNTKVALFTYIQEWHCCAMCGIVPIS